MNIMSMDPSQFYQQREDYNRRARAIRIPEDVNPMLAKALLSQIDDLYTEIRLDIVDLEGGANRVESIIREWERSKAVGSSETQRKKSATEALQNYPGDDGTVMNMYEVQRTIYGRLAAMRAVLESLSNKQSRIVTLTGLMKIDKDLTM